MSRRIDQLLAGFADGDAISSEALLIRQALRAQGIVSDIYVDPAHVSPSMMHECLGVDAYTPGDICLHHYAVGSPVLDVFAEVTTRKILVYHNITPSHFFKGYDDDLAARLADARCRLPLLAATVDAVWADSEFNAHELRALGIANVIVFPLLFSTVGLDVPDNSAVAERLAAPLTTFLSVGRIVPNKRIEVAIKAFHFYNRAIDPYSRLVIVGSGRSCPRYFDRLQMMVSDLDISNVCFEGFADPEALPTFYRKADIFISTSDHEGYCLPILEAMHHGAMVLAHGIGGMPEAAAGGGVLYRDLRPEELAVLMEIMVKRRDVREEILASQRRRMEAVYSRKSADELLRLISSRFA